MFFEKGWLPLSRLVHEAWQKYTDLADAPEFESVETDDEMDEAVNARAERISPEFHVFMWDMLYEASTKQALGCTTTAGATVLLDPWMTIAEGPSSEGGYFDLFEGRIGGGSWPTDAVKAFVGLPVVVRETYARVIIGKLAETTLAAEKLRPDEVYVQQIIDAHDRRKPVTKAWVRENITGRIKSAEFDAIWAEAARQRPSLSRSGPRGPRRSSP